MRVVHGSNSNQINAIFIVCIFPPPHFVWSTTSPFNETKRNEHHIIDISPQINSCVLFFILIPCLFYQYDNVDDDDSYYAHFKFMEPFVRMWDFLFISLIIRYIMWNF